MKTHDIEFNSTPALELADAKTTWEILGLRVKYGMGTEELQKQLGKRKDTELQKARDKVYNTHLTARTSHSPVSYERS